MRKIIFFICTLFLFFHLKAQPTCNGVLGAPIVNVTFGQGNSTQAAYSPLSTYAPGLTTNTNLQPSGFLSAANTSGLVKNGSTFGSLPQWLATNDHTGNSFGLFMGLNMTDNIGDTVVEYIMTGLCPNTTMQYSIWLVNLMSPTHPLVVSGSSLIQYPNMIMRIIDASNSVIGTFNTGNVPTDGIWHQYAYLFNNGTSSTVRLQLINNTLGSGYGNDVALDDITVRPCVPDADILPKLDTTFCKTTALTFTANISSNVYNPASYQWQYSTNLGYTWNNSGAPSASNTFNFTFSTANAPTEYWIRYQVSPGNTSSIINCHATSDTSKIRIDTITPFHLPPDTTICSNVSLDLSAAGANASNYLWSTGATTPNINIINTGNYWATASSLYGCKNSDTVNINTIQVNNPVLGNDTSFCIGTQYNLTVGNINADSYLWNTGATGPDITVIESGNYWVEAFFGNCLTSDSVHIDFNEYPVVDLGSDTTICEGVEIVLGSIQNYPGAVYKWNDDANYSDPGLWVKSPGKYWLTITNPPDCTGIDSIEINTSKCKCDLMVPNAFSPNGDARNEIFLPRLIFEGCPLDHYRMYVYNRWGQNVFFSNNPQEGWDGLMNNQPADVGTYMYYISFTDWTSGETKTYKGDLTLIR